MGNIVAKMKIMTTVVEMFKMMTTVDMTMVTMMTMVALWDTGGAHAKDPNSLSPHWPCLRVRAL